MKNSVPVHLVSNSPIDFHVIGWLTNVFWPNNSPRIQMHMHSLFISNGVGLQYCSPKFNKSWEVITKSWYELVTGDILVKELLKRCACMNGPYVYVVNFYLCFFLNYFIQLNVFFLFVLIYSMTSGCNFYLLH